MIHLVITWYDLSEQVHYTQIITQKKKIESVGERKCVSYTHIYIYKKRAE